MDQLGESSESGLRKALIWLFLLGAVGLEAELLLLGHWEDWTQWIPLILLGIGIGAAVWALISRGTTRIRFMHWVGIVYVAGGILGVWLHFSGNRLFELEMYPTIKGWKLIVEAMTGATPALAPGAMLQLGLIALIYAFRHRALRLNMPSQPS